jgi:ornithine--oxo-acid transaminase
MFDLQKLLAERGGESLDLIERYINPPFAKVLRIIGFDVHFVRGQGAYLYDQKGQQYIDCLAGYGTFACGRNHPVIRKAIQEAMDLDLPNLIKMGAYRLSGLLAEKLCQIAPGGKGAFDRVFFCNSGSEAVESAIKFARAATGRSRVVYCKKGFHGLTLGSLSVMGNAEFRDGFGPLLADCTAVPFNDLAALEAELSKGDVAAFIAEPIQGKGVNIPADDYLPGVSRLCKKHGVLFIADEVQTGLGRTGKMFAVEHWNVEPDIITVAKALSGGYIPCGAVITKKWIHEKTFSSLDRCVVHSTTFGQNDLAMVAGLATLSVMEEEKIVQNAAAMGERLMGSMRKMVGEFELVKEVRGKGLLIAIEFGDPKSVTLKMGWKLIHAADKSLFPQAIIIPMMTEHHVLTQTAGHNLDVIKLLPTLVVNEGDVDKIAAAMRATVEACHKFPGPLWAVAKGLGQHALKRKPQPAGA